MTGIIINVPETCPKCGLPNFNVSGSVYNKRNSYTVKVTCMRCGRKVFVLKDGVKVEQHEVTV